MTMDAQRFRFGLFTFDASSVELRREGVLIRLQAQPARVLAHLFSRAGEIVSREELREAIWGEETFVDFERGLNVCIAQIRTALGDDSNSPRYHPDGSPAGISIHCSCGSVSPIPPSRLPRADCLASQCRFSRCHSRRRARICIRHALAASRSSPGEPLVIAVVRFDNETGDPAINHFSDGLTDNVVVELTRMSQDSFA
jgi:hypothetical protein